MDTDRERGDPEEGAGSSIEDTEEQAKEELRQIEEDPPEKLEDWPKGKAKYQTFGGPEGEHGYHEGPEQNLGPSSLRHHEGGEVEVEGEVVENPEDYKGEPIPGGPTDRNAPRQPGERELQKEEGVTVDDPEPSGSGDEQGSEEEQGSEQ